MNNENETKRKEMAILSFIIVSSVILFLIIVIIILYLRKKYLLYKEQKELQRKKIHKFSHKENTNNDEQLQITSGRNKNYSHNTGIDEISSANTVLDEGKTNCLK